MVPTGSQDVTRSPVPVASTQDVIFVAPKHIHEAPPHAARFGAQESSGRRASTSQTHLE